jgi:hypothetical protein
VDEHCGTACLDCTLTDETCDGDTCVECLYDAECGDWYWCDAGSCAYCDTDLHCGAICQDCTATSEVCVSGSCEATSTVLFEEDWEDGDWNGWSSGGGSYTREVTNSTAANGTVYSFHIVGGATDHNDGIYTTVGTLQPSEISYWARSGSVSSADTYFLLNQGSTASLTHEVAFIYFNDEGWIYVAGPSTYVQTYNANVWYHIELKDISWTGKHYDIWVDGTLQSSNVPFRDTSKTSIGRIDLYNYHNSQAWWDEIVFYQ